MEGLSTETLAAVERSWVTPDENLTLENSPGSIRATQKVEAIFRRGEVFPSRSLIAQGFRVRDMEASRKRREVEAKLEKELSCGNKLDCLSSGMGRSRKKSCCNPFLLWKRAPDETGRFIALWALAAQPESAFPARDSGPGDGRLRVAKSRRTEGLLVLRLVCLADTRRLETPPPLSSNDGLDLIDDSGR